MRYIDSATYAALVAAPEVGLRVRDIVSVFARTLDGSSVVPFHFWSDLGTVSINVLRGDTGATESRTCVGDGALLSVGAIKHSSELKVQNVTIQFSPLHETVKNLAFGHDVRGARIEVYRVWFNPRTNEIVSSGHCEFVGKINRAPISTAKTGEESSIDVECVSHLRELTRTNPAKKSDETQKRRSGDRFRRYVGVTAKIWWGTKKEETPAKRTER